jgi:hypothetical protein
MDNNHVKQALNNTLSSLYVSDREASMLLAQAKGGKKVKKKLSVAFVMMMILVTLTFTALAVITIREVGRQVAENEKQQGYYINWTLEQKKKLINSLIELKYMDMSEDAKILTSDNFDDQAAHKTANELIATFTGKDASEVNFLSVMQVPMGPADKWTYEEKAWYSSLMRDVGLEGDGITQFVEPSGKISEEEAIRIARREVAAGYKVDESKLDSYQISVDFEIPEAAEPNNKQAYWHVKFTAPQDMSEEERLFILFPVYVHPEDGTLLWSVEDMLSRKDQYARPSNEIYQALEALEKAAGYEVFRDWPLELKARFSQEVAPRVKTALEKKENQMITIDNALDIELIAQSSYVYGLPGKESVSQEKALEAAISALSSKYDIPESTVALYAKVPTYYDITDPDKPLWRFLFNGGYLDWRSIENGVKNNLRGFCFRVEVDALTGNLVNIEKFEFKHQMDNLEYRLKWY